MTDWPNRSLGELLSYEQPGRYLVASTEYLSAGGVPVLTAGKTFVLGFTSETTGIYDAVPVIIFDDFTTASKFVTFPFKAKSSAMKMLKARQGVDLRFVYERMQLIDFSIADHKRRWIAEYSKIEIAVPPLDEQIQISRVIADAEELITSLKRLISKKLDVKRGLMQELLTARTRLDGFVDEWTTLRLDQLGNFYKGRGIRRDDVQSSGVPCIRYGELYTTFGDYTASTVSFVAKEVADTAFPIRNGDILFAASGETKEEIGMCVAYIGKERAVAGGDIIVLRGNKYDAMFLASLLNTPEVAAQKARAGQGDAVVHINARALAEVRVKVPPLDEQRAIAEVLGDIDAEIAALKGRLHAARSIKLGIMQEVLTGRTRLVAEPAV